MHTLTALFPPPEAAQAENQAAIARLARSPVVTSETGRSVLISLASARRAERAAKPRYGTLRGPQRPVAPFQASHPSQQPLRRPSRHAGITASIHARLLEPVLTGAGGRFQPSGSIILPRLPGAQLHRIVSKIGNKSHTPKAETPKRHTQPNPCGSYPACHAQTTPHDNDPPDTRQNSRPRHDGQEANPYRRHKSQCWEVLPRQVRRLPSISAGESGPIVRYVTKSAKSIDRVSSYRRASAP